MAYQIFGLLLAFFGIILIVKSIQIVTQQTVRIVETLGKYSNTLEPGLVFVIPIIQNVVAVLDMRIRQVDAEVELKTSDNMFVKLPVSIMMHIDPSSAAEAFYKLKDPVSSIRTWVLATLRAECSDMTLSQLYSDRTRLANAVQKDLKERFSGYGYELDDVLVDQPTLSDDVQAAFNRVVTSTREREAAEQEAEAKKIRILGEARAESESQALRAEGLSNARRILAKSLAESVEIAKGSGVSEQDVLYLLLETNRLDTIKYASEHGKLIVMDTKSPPNLTTPPL